MKQLLAILILFTVCFGYSQNDNPYSKFGYKGNTIKTPQERMNYMLIIPNQDTLSVVSKIGIEPKEGKYYFFDKENNVVFQNKLAIEQTSRFFAVDPLARDYPHNAPYAFSENRVLDAIELEGLEAFFIHGTSHNSNAWNDTNIPGLKESLLKFTNNKTVNTNFSWFNDPEGKRLNGLMNTYDDREIAADILAKHILKNRVNGEEITLIGYSHGGNVSIQAAKILNDKDPTLKINLITLNTPVEPAKSAFGNINSIQDNNEDPNSNAINDHFHFWTKNDAVAGGLSGGDYYHIGNDNKTINYKINDNDLDNDDKWYDPFDPHYLENVDPKEIDKKFQRKLMPINPQKPINLTVKPIKL